MRNISEPFYVHFFFESRAFYETTWKQNGGTRQAADNNVIRRRKDTRIQTHSYYL